MIAMNRPVAVAIRASATPPVMAVGCPRPASETIPKALIIPVMVPNNPSRGAKVMMVSRMGRYAFTRRNSAWAVASMAVDGESWRYSSPASSTRATGCLDSLASFCACSTFPASTNCRMIVSFSRFRRRRQKKKRSIMTAREITEAASRGIMMSPPLAKMPIIPPWTRSRRVVIISATPTPLHTMVTHPAYPPATAP